MNVSMSLLTNDFFMSAKKMNQPAVAFTLFTSLFHKQCKKTKNGGLLLSNWLEKMFFSSRTFSTISNKLETIEKLEN